MVAESVSGASSQGSEAASQAALSTTAMLRADQDDMSTHDRAFITTVWGVLYTVSKDKANTSILFAVTRLFFDMWQLWLLVVSPMYGFDIHAKATWWRAISIIQLSDFFTARGYLFYLIAMYLFMAGLLMAVALSIWVSWSFRNNNFSRVWPVRLLRGYAMTFFQVLDITSMALLLIPMDCQYFDVYPFEIRGYNAVFPSHQCWKMPHLIHVAVAAVTFLVFVTMAAVFQLSDMDLNLGTRNPLAVAHPKVELLGFFIKVFMTCATVFITNMHWLSIAQMVSAAILFSIFFKWVPHYHTLTNMARQGAYACVLWSSIMFTVLTYHWTADWHNPEKRHTFEHTVTHMMWYGLAPCFVVGALAAYLRVRYFQVTVLKRFKSAGPNTRSKEIFIFTDPRQVEIIARCCRVFIDVDDNLEPAAIKLAEKVIKVGLEQLPKSPFLIVFQSSFFIDVQQSFQTGYTMLQAAKKMDPSMLERYAMFVREQQQSQKKGGRSGQMDLVAYVELQRNYNLVLKAHKDALMSMRLFWTQLQHNKVPFENLANAVAKIDKAVHNAEQVYRIVLQRHNNSVKILRLYAKFLEHVKHDPWAAARWFAEADRVELQDEEAKENGILQELQEDPELRDAFLASRPTGGAGGHNIEGGMGVILINAFGVVQMANDGLNAMLGYSKKELHGKSINLIVPPPFSAQHDGYLRNHMATGRTVIQGKISQMISLHKDGRFVPVRLKVAKISGSGEDAMFLGMLEEMPSPPNTASIWVLPSGMVMSGDAAYTDMCGFRANEVAGMSLAALIKEHKEIVHVLKSARESFQQETNGEGGESSVFRSDTFSDPGLAKTGTLKLTGGDDTNLVKTATSNTFTKSAVSMTSTKSFTGAGGDPRLASVTSRRAARDAVKVTTTKDASGRAVSWTIVNISVHHKYADPLNVTMTITNGGIGLHMFHVIKMERCKVVSPQLNLRRSASKSLARASSGALAMAGNFLRKLAANSEANNAASAAANTTPAPVVPLPPNLMLVADAKGRITHVTEALAARLGSTPRLIMANGTPRALESLLMEPLAQLHTKHVAAAPPTACPPFSCRSGLSILLSTRLATGRPGDEAGMEGGGGDGRAAAYVPFRMSLKKKTISDQLHHVAEFKAVKPAKALGERRLLLSMDERGNILRVGKYSPKSLFGFKPSNLVGRNISSLVDVLKPGGADEPKSSVVLAEMAIKAMEAPGTSWRVGVLSSDDAGPGHADSNTLTGRMKPRSARPTVMRLYVKDTNADFDEEELLHRYARLPKQYGFEAEDEKDQPDEAEEEEEVEEGVVRAESMVPKDGKNAPSKAADAGEAEDSLDQALDVIRSKSGLGTGQKEPGVLIAGDGEDDEDVASNILIEVELWRADLLLGFMQLDSRGAVTEASTIWDHMLYDAGLVLGLEPSALEGMHISTILPALKDKPTEELFNPQLSQAAVKKRGALKSSGPGELVRVSVAHMLEGKHFSDKEPMGIVAQAVRRSSGYWVILRLHSARCGRADFKSFIMSAEDEQADNTDNRSDAAGSAQEAPPAARAKGLQRNESLAPARRAIAARFRASITDRSRPASPEAEAKPAAQPRPGVRIASGRFNAEPPSADDADGPRKKAVLVDGEPGAGGSERNKSPVQDDNVYNFEKPEGSEKQSSVKANGTGHAGAVAPPKIAWPTSSAPPPPDEHSISEPEGSEGSRDSRTEAKSKAAERAALDAAQLDDAENAENMVDDQAYKRGRRFKKLARIMGSVAIQGTRNKFKSHTLMLVAFLLMVHIGLFILIYILLKSQKTYVHLLNNVGLTAAQASTTALLARLAYSVVAYGISVSGIPAAAMPAWTASVITNATQTFLGLHNGVFLGFNGKQFRMPTEYGLRDLWEGPALPETIYYKVYVDQSKSNNVSKLANSTSMISLFKAGSRFAANSLDMAQNIINFKKNGGNPDQWPEFKYIIVNYNQSLMSGYTQTMDSLVWYVIDLSQKVNNVQLIILAAEGIVLCLLAMAYMAYLSNKMAKHRYDMYSVFMTIPGSLVRQLATQRMNLTEEDDEDDDDVDPAALAARNAANSVALNVPAAGKNGSNRKMKNSQSMSRQASAGGSEKGFWASLRERFARIGRKSNKVAPQAKHQLIPSYKSTVILMLIFVVWGALVIIINAVGYMSLKNIDEYIALFNVVNFVNALFMRDFFYLQELCVNFDPLVKPWYRQYFVDRLEELRTEYNVMVYGNQVLNDEMRKLPHYKPVRSGIAYSLKEGADLLFNVRDTCLLNVTTTCPKNTTDAYYAITMNGLNVLFNRIMAIMSGYSFSRGLDPASSGPEYIFFTTLWSHLRDGFSKLSDMYQANTVSKYTNVRLMHIVLMVLTAATFLIFLLFVLRPFLKKTSNEARRLAELLSQLPPDVDVETVLQLKLFKKGQAGAHAPLKLE